jgi:hypothetical protein
VIAAAIPNCHKILVGGGHLITPAEPAVLSFVQEILSGIGRTAKG